MTTDSASSTFPLRLMDGRQLERRYRDVLMPGGILCDHSGRARELPRYFYEVSSWDEARDTYLSRHFTVSEFIHTDVREAPPLRVFPRYIPCATLLLAFALEQLREAVGTYVFIGANGGYCSPKHRGTGGASPHCWGMARAGPDRTPLRAGQGGLDPAVPRRPDHPCVVAGGHPGSAAPTRPH